LRALLQSGDRDADGCSSSSYSYTVARGRRGPTLYPGLTRAPRARRPGDAECMVSRSREEVIRAAARPGSISIVRPAHCLPRPARTPASAPATPAPAQAAPAAGPPARGGSLKTTLGAAPGTLDAHATSTIFAYSVVDMLSPGLVIEDDKTAEIKPELAERWEA